MMNHSIKPGKPILDTDGKRIQAHGAGMFYENGTYYWYGENKEFSTGTKRVWTWGIRCYSSKDLYNWKNEGLIIPPNTEDRTSSLYPSKPVDRPHILKNKKTGKYVCWLKLSGKDAYFTMLTADAILGPYMPIGNPHRNDSSSASFNSQVSFIFQAPHWGNFYLVMADRWVPKYVVTRERYQQILRVVAHQSDKSYKPKLADYLTVASAPFLGTANTSIAEYVWLPMRFEGEMPVIDWHDEWTVDELADNLREIRKTN